MKRANFLFLLCPILPLLLLLGDSQHVFLARDVSLVFLPAKRFWVDSMLGLHSVPGWNPFSYGGIPFRADPNLSPLHPLNFLFLLFPRDIDKGYLLFVGAHFQLLALGSYLLFRQRRLGAGGALLATLAWGLSGLVFSTLNIMNVAASLVAMPFFLLFILKLRRRFSWFGSVGAAVAAAWPIYSGDPEFSYWMMLITALVFGERCWREGSWRPLLGAAAMGPLAFGLAAAQLLPALALARGAERGLGALRLAVAERFSLHPARLLEFFLALPFGNPAADSGHWQNRFTEAVFTMPFLLSLYLGVMVGALFLWRAGREAAARRWRRPWPWMLLLILLAAFGQYLFVNVYGWFYRFLPGWNLFRYPERLAFLFALGVFLWIAPHFRWLVHRLENSDRYPRSSGRAAILLLALAAMAAFLSGATSSLEVHTLAGSAAHFCLMAALFFLLVRYREKLAPEKRLALLLLLVALDLLPVGFALAWRTPVADVQFRQNTFAEKIQRNLAGRSAEIGKGAAVRYFHGTYTGPFPTASTNPLVIGQAWDWGVMYPNIPMYFGIAGAAGYGSFDPREIMEIWAKYVHSDPQRLIDIFSVAYYPLRDGDHPALQLNTAALPQVWLPAGVSLRPEQEQEPLLFQKDFPYRQRAVISGARGEWAQSAPWQIDSYARQPDVATIKVKAASPAAYLVWNERWNANWAAYQDGKRLEVLRANTWAMAVFLSGIGEHTVEFRYEDGAASAGNKITLITLLLIALGSAGTLLPFCRRRSAPSHR